MDDTDRHWFVVGGVAALLAFVTNPVLFAIFTLNFVLGFVVGVGAPLVFGVVAVACAVPLMQSRERRAAIVLAGSGAVATVVGAIYGFVQVF